MTGESEGWRSTEEVSYGTNPNQQGRREKTDSKFAEWLHAFLLLEPFSLFTLVMLGVVNRVVILNQINKNNLNDYIFKFIW